jgi:hypothetical protein
MSAREDSAGCLCRRIAGFNRMTNKNAGQYLYSCTASFAE